MTVIDVGHVRERLLEERARLAEEIATLTRTDLERDQSEGRGDHVAEGASETFEHEKSLALLDNLRALSAKVDRALAKLDEGSYGVCDDCGRSIAPERLSAIPYATFCIECKSKRERR